MRRSVVARIHGANSAHSRPAAGVHIPQGIDARTTGSGEMAIRIKSTWHDSGRNRPTAKSLEDSARALAFIAWRLALEGAKELHREGFEYLSDKERVGVISEFVAFQVQIADRRAFDRLGDAERRDFINALGQRLADHIQDNLVDIVGPGNYRKPFIDVLNERLGEYAELSFRDGEPGFDFLRFFASRVLSVMGDSQTNRWVMDQVMAIAAPEVVEKLSASMDNLFETAHRPSA
jgi:hypothetical protein